MSYRIRRIHIWSAAQVGCVFGMIVGILPVLINVLLVRFFANTAVNLLGGLDQTINLGPIPGFNLADKLQLTDTIKGLHSFDQFLVYLLLFVAGLIFVGLMMGALSALAAWIYNQLAPRNSGLSVILDPIGPAAAAAPAPIGNQPPQVQVAQPVAAPPLGAPSRAVPPPQVQPSPASAPVARPSPVQSSVTNPVPPLPTASGPRLSLASNPTQVWFISKSPYTIGSEAGSDLYAGQLAPRHARVEYEPAANGYVLSDLSNGQTWVNDHQVQGRHKLNNNFRVRFGQVDLIFNL